MQEKKKVPHDIMERDEFFRERTKEVMDLLSQYELPALDYIKLMDFIKNQGLAQFKFNSDQLGPEGIPGPTSMTNFEILDGIWTEKHGVLNGLCVQILNYLNKNPELASRVEITRKSIQSKI